MDSAEKTAPQSPRLAALADGLIAWLGDKVGR